MNLGRKGVVWLEGRAIQIERTGGDRAVARLAGGDLDGPPQEPDTLMTDSGQTVIAAAIGETTGPGPDDLEPGQPSTLLAGGRRRKDSLAAIDRWYRRQARERIEAEVTVESTRLGLVRNWRVDAAVCLLYDCAPSALKPRIGPTAVTVPP